MENFPSAAQPASASLGSPPAAPRAWQDSSLLGGNARITLPIEKKAPFFINEKSEFSPLKKNSLVINKSMVFFPFPFKD